MTTIIIPVCGFISGLFSLITQIRTSSIDCVRTSNIFIGDDSPISYRQHIKELCKKYDAVYYPISGRESGGHLYTFINGFKFSFSQNDDIVFTMETDAVINDITLQNMIQCYKTFYHAGSVSPTYVNPSSNTMCLPAVKDWFNADNEQCINIINHQLFGRVAQSLYTPFLCALWNISVARFFTTKLPKFKNLDPIVGKVISSSGYYHLRLLDYSIGHYNGGHMSRHKKLPFNDDFNIYRKALNGD